MNIDIPHGTNMQRLSVPDDRLVGVSLPKALAASEDPATLVEQKLASAFGALAETHKTSSGATACITVTDRTRSTPLRLIVPILLDQLKQIGIGDEQVTILSGGGMHAPDLTHDLRGTLGKELLERVEVLTNEPDNGNVMSSLGRSSFGTPVEVHQRFADADLKLGVINVNPCMLAGWSGGGKIVQPAVSSRRSIYENHKHFVGALMELGCASLMGIMPPENPVRADIEDCAQISGIDLIVNTVLDKERKLVDLFCGDVVTAHRAAVERMAPYVEASLPAAADILVAAVGEPALEVSLFQGGSRVCGGADRYLRPGGTLIMVNACTEGIYEGFEHEEYREWMRRMPTPAEIGDLVQNGSMGGEKGCVLFTFSWLLHRMNCRIIVVTSGMSAAELESVHLGHAPTVQDALEMASTNYPGGPSIGVMPYAGLVLPILPT